MDVLILSGYPFKTLYAIALLAIILCFGPTDNWRWDPSFYYAQMRSPFIDWDLDIGRETIPESDHREPASGLRGSPWPIGPGLLWFPFFLVAHIFVSVTQGVYSADGLSSLYIAFVSAGSALYGFLGMLVIYRSCRLFASHGPALLTTALAMFATPLFFYVYRQPIMAHSAGVLASSLLVYIVVLQQGTGKGEEGTGAANDEGRTTKDERRKLAPDSNEETQDAPRTTHHATRTSAFLYSGLLIGALIGLNGILRWVGVTVALLPGVLGAFALIEALRQSDMRGVREIAVQGLIAVCAMVAVFAPQMAFWQTIYHSWIAPPSQGFAQGALPVNLGNLFVHTNRGILFWSPFILIGMIGIFRVRPLRLRVAMLVYIVGYLYVLSTRNDWFGGGGFGPRYFIELLPLVAVGFVTLLQPLWHRRAVRRIALLVAAGLIAHQMVLIVMVEHAWLPLQEYFTGQPISLNYQSEALQRIIHEPNVLLTPRPYVGAHRQAIIVSLVAGQRDITMYTIPLIAAIIVPLGFAWIWKLGAGSWELITGRPGDEKAGRQGNKETRGIGDTEDGRLDVASSEQSSAVGRQSSVVGRRSSRPTAPVIGVALLIAYMVGWFLFLLAL